MFFEIDSITQKSRVRSVVYKLRKNVDDSVFTVHVGAKFITRNASFSENELDARRWKKNSKTRWIFTDGENSRYSDCLWHDISQTEPPLNIFLFLLLGKRPKHIRDDPEDSDFTKTPYTKDRRGWCDVILSRVCCARCTMWAYAFESLWRHNGLRPQERKSNEMSQMSSSSVSKM